MRGSAGCWTETFRGILGYLNIFWHPTWSDTCHAEKSWSLMAALRLGRSWKIQAMQQCFPFFPFFSSFFVCFFVCLHVWFFSFLHISKCSGEKGQGQQAAWKQGQSLQHSPVEGRMEREIWYFFLSGMFYPIPFIQYIYIYMIYIYMIYLYIYMVICIYIYTYFIYPYISCYEVMRCSASLWHAWIFFPRFIHLQRFFCCFFILFQQSGRGRSPSATRGQRQVKKGNKPYTDDLTQLRAKPEDFQSEEEEVDSASEVGMGKKGGWFWHIS